MDDRIVEGLNRWFSATASRAELDRVLAIAPLFLIVGLLVVAWLMDWGAAPHRRAILILGVAGAVLALALNVGIGHLYYRPRPYLRLPIDALLPHAPDSSLFSDHLAVAGALTAALAVTRRWIGGAALVASILLGIARVGAGVHFPSDVAVGFVAGTVTFALLLPLRRPLERVVAAVSRVEGSMVPRTVHERSFILRHRPVVFAAALVLVAALSYGVRALQDRGPLEAAARQESSLLHAHDRPPPDAFPGADVAAIAAGTYRGTHAAVVATVTQVTHELDGDVHIRLESEDAFIVAEIMPEFPMEPPVLGEEVTAWGVVRHDGLHNWWELHPLIGWADGELTQVGGSGPGTGD
ncbi:MAG: phosphatase PAP2 family protein [Actinomycetota bacterium]